MIRRGALAVAAMLCAGVLTSMQAIAEPQHPLKVVLIGESLIAGDGADNGSLTTIDTESYSPATVTPENSCFRSKYSGALLAMQRLGIQGVTFAACSGARMENYLDTPQSNSTEGVQINAVKPDTDLVVMTLLGNPELENVAICVADPTKECTEQDQVVQSALADIATTRRDQERAVYRAIKQIAPHAKIVSVGVASMAPKTTSDIGTSSLCSLFLTPAELPTVNKLPEALNRTMRLDAAEFGATFVDLTAPDSLWTHGRYDFCSPTAAVWGPRGVIPPDSRSWTNPVIWIGSSFHPMIYGQWMTSVEIEQAAATLLHLR